MTNKKLSKELDKFLMALSKVGLNTKVTAEMSGVSVHSLSNWRQGKSYPNQSNLMKLRDYSLSLLSIRGLQSEVRDCAVSFFREAEITIRDMPRIGEKEEKILNDHHNNQKALSLLERMLDFNQIDTYLNTDTMQGFQIDKQNKVDRIIQRNYKKTFSENLNRLIDFIDEGSDYEREGIKEWPLFSGDLKEELFFELYDNLPHEEDFDIKRKIPSIGELWLEKNLGVSKTQIKSWREGKDFPNDENLGQLKKIVRMNGKGAFLGYEFSESDLLHMFLKTPRLEAENRADEAEYFETLAFFTNVLFTYCGSDEEVEELQQSIEENLISESKSSIVRSFFDEVWHLRASREITRDSYTDKNMPEMIRYFEMADNEVEYALNKDNKIVNSIFSEENVKLIEKFSDKYFDVEQKSALSELISQLRVGKSIPQLRLRLEPKFQKLYFE
ncbi:hypothetical protein ACFC90_13840 [Enterococcus casseliflavus]|uniref:hypothetical protein n=1 Tax=Enterococcus casseliflavus TaxID=37734 RepID=UPI0039A6FF23